MCIPHSIVRLHSLVRTGINSEKSSEGVTTVRRQEEALRNCYAYLDLEHGDGLVQHLNTDGQDLPCPFVRSQAGRGCRAIHSIHGPIEAQCSVDETERKKGTGYQLCIVRK